MNIRQFLVAGLLLARALNQLSAAPDGSPGANAQAAPPPPNPAAEATKPAIAWDAPLKEIQVKFGETSARTFFTLTNISSTDVVVTTVRPSCGCTTAQLPPLPWTNAPGAVGRIDLTIDVKGKSGTLFKSLVVESTAGRFIQQIRIVLPDLAAERERNQQLAMNDRQTVFRNDCAVCHVTPAAGKQGGELFAAMCGVCHEAEHRASMVPNLRQLQVPTDREFWKTWITYGKPNSLMPAFAQNLGGPLTDTQIESLVDYLVKAIPSRVASPVPPAGSAMIP